MANSTILRSKIESNLDSIVVKLNEALRGEDLDRLVDSLTRIGRNGVLAPWYEQLAREGTLPNLDGKTIGSVVEMLLAAVLECDLFGHDGIQLRVNPARGVDFPELDLSVKAPSSNWCTSEPFFSAYERLLGGENDALILLTNYQEQKKRPPLRLQISSARYLRATQMADQGLCGIAARMRSELADQEARLKRVVRFIAYVNQSSWRAKYILRLLAASDGEAHALLVAAPATFDRVNRGRVARGNEALPDTELAGVLSIEGVAPVLVGAIDAADNWVVEEYDEFARLPNENEWQRFLASPLDGKIGMSFALQWRYNFQRAFSEEAPSEGAESEIDVHEEMPAPDC